MKRLIFSIMCIAIVVFAFNCKKKPGITVQLPYCSTCDTFVVAHAADTDSVSYFLPTAFTPNGDGRNDVFALTYRNLDTANSTMTIWDAANKVVFISDIGGFPRQGWDGVDQNGNKCVAGNYRVLLQLKTKKDTAINICACVTLLQYTGSCLKTNGVNYHFIDQINPSLGFIYPTTETICP
jgi:gliding motility-associated-like protein